MHFLDLIREALHQIAGILIWPVIVALLALLATTIMSAGAFASEAIRRSWRVYTRRASAFHQLDDAAASSEPDLDLRLERTLQEAEQRWRHSLDRARLAVRLGPSLGLMGTLIPMANALSALASGDLPSLAGNMVTAFAATVIGLAISVVSYLLASVRQEWLHEDLREINFHAETLLRGTKTPVAEAGYAIR
jgi:biopolymer transport protein ExbB/TolQ